LGIDSFVFVDDDPLQIAEVQKKLPRVKVFQFPGSDDHLPQFLNDLAQLFARESVTEEDRHRTDFYRRNLAGMLPSKSQGANLRDFLVRQNMVLTLYDRSKSNRQRAEQMLHKINQFNLNGRRWESHEIESLLARKGRLFTAELEDKNGKHGEILSCLISPEGIVESLVLSCRVFQRRVEHAFLLWLLEHGCVPSGLRYKKTDRNDPLRQFIETWAVCPANEGLVPFDAQVLSKHFSAERELFTFVEEGEQCASE
jgi:FkbH-like protein